MICPNLFDGGQPLLIDLQGLCPQSSISCGAELLTARHLICASKRFFGCQICAADAFIMSRSSLSMSMALGSNLPSRLLCENLVAADTGTLEIVTRSQQENSRYAGWLLQKVCVMSCFVTKSLLVSYHAMYFASCYALSAMLHAHAL